MRFACVLLSPRDEALQVPLAEACLRFTPDIALGSRTIFLEIGRCSSLYSEASFLARLKVLLERFRVKASVALATDLPTSFAFAVFRMKDRQKLPVEALSCYFSPFLPDPSLDPLLHSLGKLGVKTLEEFMRLPPASIGKKLGRDALLARHRLQYPGQVVWNRFQVSEQIMERFDVESHEALYEYESIVFSLKRLLDRVLMRTRGLGMLVSKMKLKFHLDTYRDDQENDREWSLAFSFPHRSVKSFLDMIRDRVGADLQRFPLPAPVLRIELVVEEMVRGNPSQFQLFSRKEEQQEEVNLFMERLSEKMGKEAIFYASSFESYMPERSWKKSRASGSARIGRAFRERPLRVFPVAEPLRRMDRYLIGRERRWRIVSWSGPERITGEWWIDDTGRDYYEVQTEEEKLWIYRNPENVNPSEEWLLHGVFD